MNENEMPQKLFFVLTIDEEEIRYHKPLFPTQEQAVHFGKLLGTTFYVQEFIESHTQEYPI